jgi:hypothetical protein
MKAKAIILQTDNRTDCDYLGLSQTVNTNQVRELNSYPHTNEILYEYVYKHMEPSYYTDMHPACGKIDVVREFISNHTSNTSFLVFLDSDAWIQQPTQLHRLLLHLLEMPDIHGAFSRDPYIRKNTYINSGSFILKINDYTRAMYDSIYNSLLADPRFHHTYHNEEYFHFIYDQYYISNKIYECREHFLIFQPELLNTPVGTILRHNWHKTYKLFKDMYKIMDGIRDKIIDIPPELDYDAELDKEPFPNTSEHGKEYWRL